jgi:vitamin B12 transporter
VKAKLNARLPLAIELEAFSRLHWSSARSFPDSSGGPELAGLRQLEDRDVREILFGLSLERDLGPRGALLLRLSRYSRRQEVDSPGIDPEPGNPANPNVVPPSKTDDDYRRWDLGLTSSWRLPKIELAGVDVGTRLMVGSDIVWEDGESDARLDFGGGFTPFPFFDNRRTVGVYGELEQEIGPFVIASASVRYDSTPDESDRLSPSVGLTIDLPDTPITLFGAYGKGFKRPSFFALNSPLVGNSTLEVEKSGGWEVGIRGTAPDGRLRANRLSRGLAASELDRFIF